MSHPGFTKMFVSFVGSLPWGTFAAGQTFPQVHQEPRATGGRQPAIPEAGSLTLQGYGDVLPAPLWV